MARNLRLKSEHTRHFSAHRGQLRSIDHVFKKMYRDESFSKQAGRCCYCDARLSRGSATAEHIVPVSCGGSTTRDNIKVSCRTCNYAKGSMTDSGFRRLLQNKEPPPFDRFSQVLAWVAYRINKRVKKAERRISKFVGMQTE